jgi:hypothetical protein
MNNLQSIQIVPAQPDFYTIIDFKETRELDIGEPVIAWRIETYSTDKSESLFSVCIPITVDGDAVSNCIGVKNPDGTVTIFEEATYRSFIEACEHKYPNQ